MHRFNIAHGLLETAVLRGRGGAELAALAVWLRLSAARLLTWNRSYNIKPREISAAQARLRNPVFNPLHHPFLSTFFGVGGLISYCPRYSRFQTSYRRACQNAVYTFHAI